LWQAGIESFFVNVRTTVEFLGIRSDGRESPPTDISAKAVAPTWSPPTKTGDDAATWKRLNYHWDLASKSVIHLTDSSVQSDVVPTRQLLDEIADDVLTLWERFAEHVEYKPLLWRRVKTRRSSWMVHKRLPVRSGAERGTPANPRAKLGQL
jgi:hypothetical protein